MSAGRDGPLLWTQSLLVRNIFISMICFIYGDQSSGNKFHSFFLSWFVGQRFRHFSIGIGRCFTWTPFHLFVYFTCSQHRFRPSIRRPIRCRNHGMGSIDFRLQWICFETIHILKRFADNVLANIPFFNSCSVRNYRVSQCHQLWGHHLDVPFHPFSLDSFLAHL